MTIRMTIAMTGRPTCPLILRSRIVVPDLAMIRNRTTATVIQESIDMSKWIQRRSPC